jgi:hypothetical protein
LARGRGGGAPHDALDSERPEWFRIRAGDGPELPNPSLNF